MYEFISSEEINECWGFNSNFTRPFMKKRGRRRKCGRGWTGKAVEILFAQDIRLKTQAGAVPQKVRMLQGKLGTHIPERELFLFFQHGDHKAVTQDFVILWSQKLTQDQANSTIFGGSCNVSELPPQIFCRYWVEMRHVTSQHAYIHVCEHEYSSQRKSSVCQSVSLGGV